MCSFQQHQNCKSSCIPTHFYQLSKAYLAALKGNILEIERFLRFVDLSIKAENVQIEEAGGVSKQVAPFCFFSERTLTYGLGLALWILRDKDTAKYLEKNPLGSACNICDEPICRQKRFLVRTRWTTCLSGSYLLLLLGSWIPPY